MKHWLAGAGGFFLYSAVCAGQAINPPTARHIGVGGETQQGEFMVTNIYPNDVDVNVEISNQGYTTAGPAALPTGNWIVVTTPLPIRLKPEETKALEYSVTFPPNLTKESVGLITLVVTRTGDSMAVALVRRGLPVYLEPGSADATPSLTLREASVRLVSAPSDATVARVLEASVNVENTGTVQLKPEGSVTWKQGGMVLETCPLTGQSPLLAGMTSPYTTRTTGTQWKNGDYEAVVHLGYGDAYGKPKTMEKTYRFRVDGEMITVSPGSSSAESVTPR